MRLIQIDQEPKPVMKLCYSHPTSCQEMDKVLKSMKRVKSSRCDNIYRRTDILVQYKTIALYQLKLLILVYLHFITYGNEFKWFKYNEF